MKQLWGGFHGLKINIGKNLHSGKLTFGRKNKLMEGSRCMTFTHNVDQDMIKIIGERNFIYLFRAI